MLLPYFSDWWRQRLNSCHRRPVDPIEEMVYALTDPIIVFPAGGWENDLPFPPVLVKLSTITFKYCSDSLLSLQAAPC